MKSKVRSKLQTPQAALICGAVLAMGGAAQVVQAQQFFQRSPSAQAQAPALAPAPTAPEPIREGVLAIVDDEIITSWDLKQRMLWLAMNGIQVNAQTMPVVQNQAMRSLVDERLQEHELNRQAEQRKLDRSLIFADDRRIDAYLSQVASLNNLSLDQFMVQVNRTGLTTRAVREQAKMTLSWRQWIQGVYGNRIRISEDQANAYLRELKASASKPRYQVSEIFLPADDAAGMATAMAAANQILSQLRQGANFGQLAQQFSAATTAAKGGDAGWLFASQMAPEVVAALDGIQVDEVAPPVQVNGGVYIVGLRDKEAGNTAVMVNLKQLAIDLPLTASPDVADSARARLLAAKSQISDCASMDGVAQANNLQVGDLGRTNVSDLDPTFHDAVENLQAGQVTDPIRTQIGLHIVAVCDRTTGGGTLPSLAEIKDELFSKELALIERREMRNLRNAATITQIQAGAATQVQ